MKRSPSEESSLTTGYFWTFGSTALPLASAFIVSLIVARLMGPRIAGLINWVMALATVFLIIGKFGVEGAASRLISGYHVSAPGKIPRLVRYSVILRLLFTIPVAAAATAFAGPLARFFGDPDLLPLFRISGLLIFAVSLNELAALLILGLRAFRTLFVMRLSMFVLRVSLVFAVAMAALEALGVIWAFIIAALLPALAVLFLLYRYRPVQGDPGNASDIWGKLLRLSATLAVSGASVTIYSLLDKLMLGKFEGAAQVGLYSMARNVLETSLFPTFALIMTLRPALAGAYEKGDIARCSSLVSRSVRSSMSYSSCVVVVFACLARPLVTGLFTEKFSYSADLLLLFLPLIVMRSLGSVILPGLIAADRAGTYAKLTLVGAVLNFGLNMLLIPVWHAKGAVVSTLISYLPIEVLGLRSLAQVYPGYWTKRDFVKALKTLVSGAAIVLLYRRFVPMPHALPSALIHGAALAAVFSGTLLAVKALEIDELKHLLSPFRKLSRNR